MYEIDKIKHVVNPFSFFRSIMDWRFFNALVLYYDIWFSLVYFGLHLACLGTRMFSSLVSRTDWTAICAFAIVQSSRLMIGLKSVRDRDRFLSSLHVFLGIPLYLIQMCLLFFQRQPFLIETTMGCIGFVFSFLELFASTTFMYQLYYSNLASSRALPLSAVIASFTVLLFSIIYRPYLSIVRSLLSAMP